MGVTKKDSKLALENALLKEKIQHLKDQLATYRYDNLTGFKLRKDFNDKFFDYFSQNHKFHLTIIDINGLHRVNKNMSYLDGDNLIRKVANYLVENCDGCLFRIGGDEFAILSINPPICEENPNFVYGTECSTKFNSSREMFNAVDKALKLKKESYYLESGNERRT